MTTSLQFFGYLNWLDGKPLLPMIEQYRRRLFTSALDIFGPDGLPIFNFVLAGRGKKNNKTLDLVLAAFYKLLIPESVQGSDGYLVASDEDQAGDDLSLAKKLIAANSVLQAELEVYQKEIRRRDGRGTLRILPARDVSGAHGKQGNFIGYDEVHTQRTWDLFEALAPDPTRRDVLQWVTSYDTIYSVPGVPLYDLKEIGKSGTDPRMLFSWYSGDFCSDPDFANLPPEQRANPSMASWPEGAAYIEQQRRRLPTHKFRRLHLNLPGAPNGAFFDQGAVMAAVPTGIKVRPFQEGIEYRAFVDMSGGSNDDATLAIGHAEGKHAVLDVIMKQAGVPPFNPRDAVARFARTLHDYGLATVTGDAYAGQTFRLDFEEEHGIAYRVSARSASDNYERIEPRLNAGEVELLDDPTLIEQLLCLVMRGSRVDHQAGGHDDFSAAAAGCLNLCLGNERRYLWGWLPSLFGPKTEAENFDEFCRVVSTDPEPKRPDGTSYKTPLSDRRSTVQQLRDAPTQTAVGQEILGQMFREGRRSHLDQ